MGAQQVGFRAPLCSMTMWNYLELLSSVLEPVLLPWKLRRNDVQCCKCPFVRYPSRRSIMCSVDSKLFASRDRYVQGCFAERVNCNFKKISETGTDLIGTVLSACWAPG